MIGGGRAVLTAAVLALGAALPARAAQAPGPEDGVGLHLDFALESLFDGGLVPEAGDTGAYGGAAAAAVRFQTHPYRPAMQIEYAAAARGFYGSERWDRTTHRVRGLLGTSLGDPLHLETIGWLSLAGSTDDRERVDELAVVPRLAWRLGRSDRIRLRGGARWRRAAGGDTPARGAVLARLEYRHRFGRDRTFEVEYRYEDSRSDDRYASDRSIIGVAFASRLGRHHGVVLTADHRRRHYPHRRVDLGDREVLRRDRIWMPGVVWSYAKDGAELRASYRYEARASTDPDRAFTAHRLTIALRRTVALLGSARPFRFDTDPWDVVGTPPSPVRFATIRVGGAHVCGVADGAAYCWEDGADDARDDGIPRPVPVSDGAEWAGVSVGEGPHSCGVTRDGTAYCWRSTDSPSVTDAPVRYPHSPVRVSGSYRFRTVSVGWAHMCGITTEGRALCWGDNGDGAVGDGSLETRLRPTAVASTASFRAVSAGWRHTCALADDGTAYCWGGNDRGQLGIGALPWAAEPRRIEGMRFTALSAGTRHTCAIALDGAAYCWGANHAGQLGSDVPTSADRPTPVAGGLRFAAVSAGWAHTCGITLDGAAYCWGQNRYGQLGDGTRDTERHPRPVPVDAPGPFHAVSASFRSCAIGAQGTVFCWGDRRSSGHGPAAPVAMPPPGRPMERPR